MVLIYSHTNSARLQYVCSFIFKELIGIDYKHTIDSEQFRSHAGPKINYSDTRFGDNEFYLHNHSLLFEHGIQEQYIDCFVNNNHKAFFRTAGSDYPFDIFAAVFYLISRYEEYLPHEKDSYERYAHDNSLAYREGFLQVPLVNLWVIDFTKALQLRFPLYADQLTSSKDEFKFIPTYDIDMAYAYKHKGLLRNLGGFLKSPSMERLLVISGLKQDPFDCYNWLNELHKQCLAKPIYFFLVAEKNSRYDKQILPHKDVMWKLLKRLGKKYTVGLHPSWQSGDESTLLKKEKKQLEEMCEKPVLVSRQHYIRFNLPEGYRQLLQAGLQEDYSMGYGSINGFRASVAASFFWYDLEQELTTRLRIHPFCFMDANAFYEQKQSVDQTRDELLHYATVCKQVNGTMISIWHNHMLGNDVSFKGWKKLYEEFIAQSQQ